MSDVPSQLRKMRRTAHRLLVKTMEIDRAEFVEHLGKNHDRLKELSDNRDECEMDEFVLRLAAEYAFSDILLMLDRETT